MTMVKNPAVEVARTSTVQDTTLVMVSTPLPTSSSTTYASSSQCLEDDVVLQFDATHHLSELTMAWGRLLARAAYFGEQLQVSAFCFMFSSCLASVASFFSLSSFSYWRSPSLVITLASLD
jgi:hypothetical protein